MHRTVEATIDAAGVVTLSETVELTAARRALVTILEEPAVDDVTRASERALAQDWLKPEEDEAWSHLQSGR
jgi:hypothetical protein